MNIHDSDQSNLLDEKHINAVAYKQVTPTINTKNYSHVKMKDVPAIYKLIDQYFYLPTSKDKKAKLGQQYKKIIYSCSDTLGQLKSRLLAGSKTYQKKYMITSSRPKEGVTTTAITIAVALSNCGYSRVLLIDANANNPEIANAFSLPQEAGFAEYILGQESKLKRPITIVTIADALEKYQLNNELRTWVDKVYFTEYPRLFVMPFTEKEGVSIWDLVEHPSFNIKMNDLNDFFDFIILDASSVTTSSGALSLAKHVDGVVFVVSSADTKWEVAKNALTQLQEMEANLLGCVLNRQKFYIPEKLYEKM